MLGVLVNVVTVLIGSTVGLIFKKGISKKYTDAVKCGFEMKHNVKYDIYEVLNNV